MSIQRMFTNARCILLRYELLVLVKQRDILLVLLQYRVQKRNHFGQRDPLPVSWK